MKRALFVLVAACSNDDSGGPYVAITEFRAQLHAAECRHLVTCGEVSDQATCLAINDYALAIDVDAQTVSDVLTGSVRYNGSVVADCFEKYATRSCDQTALTHRASLTSCLAAAYTGSVIAGQPCVSNTECASQVCAFHSCTVGEICCVAMCSGSPPPVRGPIALGGACVISDGLSDCVSGSYCDAGTGVCTAVKPLGATCNGPQECGDGLDCNLFPVGGAAQACIKRPGRGESCVTDTKCTDEGTACDSISETCQNVALLGESCMSVPCSPLYMCDPASESCVAFPATGSACDPAGRCNDYGAYCTSARICALPQPNGASCGSDIDCASQHCDLTTMTCATFKSCI